MRYLETYEAKRRATLKNFFPENEIYYEGEYYYSIKEFDCHVISLQTTPSGGGFCTVIPISSKEYRAEHPNPRVKVYISEDRKYVIFNCHDEYGTPHIMKIPKRMKKEINDAINGAIAQDIPIIPLDPVSFNHLSGTPIKLNENLDNEDIKEGDYVYCIDNKTQRDLVLGDTYRIDYIDRRNEAMPIYTTVDKDGGIVRCQGWRFTKNPNHPVLVKISTKKFDL